MSGGDENLKKYLAMPNWRTLANSVDPDETPHLLRQKRSSAKEIQFYLESISCDRSNYT